MVGPTEQLAFVKAYIDDLLCIAKGLFDDHLSEFQHVLSLIHDTRLKVNERNQTFGMANVEYLWFILTYDDIKPHPKY